MTEAENIKARIDQELAICAIYEKVIQRAEAEQAKHRARARELSTTLAENQTLPLFHL